MFLSRIVRQISRFFTDLIDPPLPQPTIVNFRQLVFLVRTGEYRVLDDYSPGCLTTLGRWQVRVAGQIILRQLKGSNATVLLCDEAPVGYQETAAIIAEVLEVEPVDSALQSSPGAADLFTLEQFEGAVVIVCNGTQLEQDLRRHSGPRVEFGPMGPAHGSVHLQIVEYRTHPILDDPYREVTSRVFVACG